MYFWSAIYNRKLNPNTQFLFRMQFLLTPGWHLIIVFVYNKWSICKRIDFWRRKEIPCLLISIWISVVLYNLKLLFTFNVIRFAARFELTDFPFCVFFRILFDCNVLINKWQIVNCFCLQCCARWSNIWKMYSIFMKQNILCFHLYF